jgi:alcohol dehydrogenase (cytochrome c)
LKFLIALFSLAVVSHAQTDRADAQKNPFAGDVQAIAAGQKLYSQACIACHGSGARGGRGPSLVSGNLKHGNADGEVFLTIRSGVRGTQMPSFASFTTEQIWQLVSYLRSLSALPGGEAPPDLSTADATAGKAILAGKGGCLGCHVVNGAGVPVGPDLSTSGTKSVAELKASILKPGQTSEHIGKGWGIPSPATVTAKTSDGTAYRGVLKGLDSFSVQMLDTTGTFHSFEKEKLARLDIEPGSLMPGDFSNRLTEREIQNVVAYMKTLQAPGVSQLSPDKGLTWDRLRSAGKEPQNYLSYWGDLGGKHFAPLSQINTSNVKGLQARWAVQLPGDGIVESIPLVVDGVMYTMGPVGGTAQVLALDAKTGQVIWHYERKQKVTNPYEINRVSRGVTILGDRLFFGTLDAALVALDARTGAFLWESQVADTKLGYSITSPPLAVKDKIITGISGGEFGTRGFLDAYDAASGKRLWRWYSVPEKGELGNDTWDGDSWQRGGGPTWLTGSYDPDLNLLYWAVGNPGPDLNGDVRKGDNLFTCSVVALDPDTGHRKWHYQFTPNDTHDWDSVEDLILVDRKWHGKDRKLLLHADRNGVFYVLDRTDGKLLAASPYVRATWVKGWDTEGHPITTENWRSSAEGATVYPSLGGGTNFQSPSYSPQTGLTYLVYYDGPTRYTSGPAPYEAGKMYQGSGPSDWSFPQPKDQAPPSAGILAFDAETGKACWRFVLPEAGIQSGVLSTAGGLVFAGTPEGNLIALDAKSGTALWRFGTGATIPSSPMSYSVDGKQYIAVSSANVLYSFALPD